MSSFEKFTRGTEDDKVTFIPLPPEKQNRVIDYIRTTTDRYFMDWGDVVLEGSPGIKEKIKENILRAEQLFSDRYKNDAKKEGLSEKELRERLQKKVEDLVEKASFFRATSISVIENIMIKDGRWKSQFETGTSNGTLDPERRAGAEEQMFGFEKKINLNSQTRPIYGYFTDGENGEINSGGEVPPPNNVHQYGEINFKIKKEKALKRATVTFQDSLGSYDEYPPTPASKPHYGSLMIGYRYLPLGGINTTKKKNWGDRYTEVQYHGGLTMDDVESIHISTKNGMTEGHMRKVRDLYKKYMELHPESDIKLIEY